jgi:hypothetical protein
MAQLFEQLLPIAMKCGISIWEYWELTYGEIALVIENHNEMEMQRVREQATMNYIHAHLVSLSVARLMDKNAKYPPIHEVYSNLFEAPIEEKKEDWRIVKERMSRYAEAHNKKRGAVINDN